MEKLFNDTNFDYKLSDNFKSQKNTLQESQLINEGLVFYKASTRLKKMAEKLAKKNSQIQDPKIKTTIRKILKLADKFEYVEDLYDCGRKKEAKAKYAQLKQDYTDLLKLLNNHEVKTLLKKIGAISITMAAMVVPYIALGKFFPSLELSVINNMASGKDKTFALLKRAGAFTLLGFPTKFISAGNNALYNNYENKMLKNVDRILNSNDVEQSAE